MSGAGGRLGVLHARALKQADPSLYLIGIDADPIRITRAETDEVHLVPRASDPAYIPVVAQVVLQTDADLLLTNVTADIPAISAGRDRLGCTTFLPDHETVMLCEDKAASNAVWQKAGVPVPSSMRINDQGDLKQAFDEYGEKIWLRAVVGSGASGALPVSDMESAISWINLNKGWGRFMAAELLGPQTVSWESVWSNGELVVAQSRRRLYWEFGRIAMSGVSGIAGAGEAIADPEIDQVGLAAVRAVAERPNGVLGVDVAYDMEGNPKVTEINPGRFMSGASCHFASKFFNVPYAAVQAAFGEDGGFQRPLLNPVTPGTIFVSGLDRVPVFTTRFEIEQRKSSLELLLKEVSEPSGTV